MQTTTKQVSFQDGIFGAKLDSVVLKILELFDYTGRFDKVIFQQVFLLLKIGGHLAGEHLVTPSDNSNIGTY